MRLQLIVLMPLRRACLLLLAWGISMGPATAEPLYVQTGGPFPGISGNTPGAISWTQADVWVDVEISLSVFSNCGGFPDPCGGTGLATGRVYLTNSIGAGTTQAANEIAAADISTTLPAFQTLSAFSGLTLLPGTYYLVFSYGRSLDLGWEISDQFAVDVGPGVSAGPRYLYLGDLTGGYEPAENPFFPVIQHPVFSISGTRVVTPVPEPSLLLLGATGIVALVARRWHRPGPRERRDAR